MYIIENPYNFRSFSETFKVEKADHISTNNTLVRKNIINKNLIYRTLTFNIFGTNKIKLFENNLHSIYNDEGIYIKNWESDIVLTEDALIGATLIKCITDVQTNTQELWNKGIGYYYRDKEIIISDGINRQVVKCANVFNWKLELQEPLLYDFNKSNTTIYCVDNYKLKNLTYDISNKKIQNKSFKLQLELNHYPLINL